MTVTLLHRSHIYTEWNEAKYGERTQVKSDRSLCLQSLLGLTVSLTLFCCITSTMWDTSTLTPVYTNLSLNSSLIHANRSSSPGREDNHPSTMSRSLCHLVPLDLLMYAVYIHFYFYFLQIRTYIFAYTILFLTILDLFFNSTVLLFLLLLLLCAAVLMWPSSVTYGSVKSI